MYNLCIFTVVMKDMKEKRKSKRLEFTKAEIKLIDKAAELQNRSAKQYMELTIIAATLNALQSWQLSKLLRRMLSSAKSL